ncbi:MAG: hypothetical protein ACKOPS_25160, partial [Cyanobium sp.]
RHRTAPLQTRAPQRSEDAMHYQGDNLVGLETGNAWALRDPLQPAANWLVGDHPAIPADSLRFVGQPGAGSPESERLEHLALKWFEHQPGDDPAWGEHKPISSGRTLSLLAGGGVFELQFRRGGQACTVLLEQAGDFALWGEGLEHRWRALAPSTVISLRWSLKAEVPDLDVHAGER